MGESRFLLLVGCFGRIVRTGLVKEAPVARYMWAVSYTKAGMEGLMKEGGTSRRTMIEKLAANMGGKIESFYFAFGEYDAYIVAEFPGDVDATAVALTVGAAGAATLKTITLLTPEQVDEATQKTVEYRPPGQ
jgi:uncharacterized protein with GYD domain